MPGWRYDMIRNHPDEWRRYCKTSIAILLTCAAVISLLTVAFVVSHIF